MIADEYKGVKPIALFTVPVQGLSMRDPIKSVDDLKGRRIRAADRTISLMVTAFGASPISVPSTENYQAVAQGLVTGSVANIIQMVVFRLAEVSKYQLFDIPLGSPAGFIVMNPDVPGSFRKRAQGSRGRDRRKDVASRWAPASKSLDGFLKKKLHADKTQHFITLEPAEKAKFEKALQPVNDQWIKETPDGDKIYAAFKKDVSK